MFMKKKFINGLLMVAMFVGATSSLVSCKDYDDEKNISLQEQFAREDAKLAQLIQDLDDTLSERIRILRGEFETCRDNCAATRDTLYKYIRDYNDFKTWVYNNIYTKDQVYTKQETITEITNRLANYYTKQDIDTKFGDYYTKGDVDGLIDAAKGEMGEKIQALSDSLSNYVTAETLADSLLNYYDKQYIDDLFNSLNNRLDPDGDLGNVINELIEKYMEGKTFGGDTTIINNITNEYNTYVNGIDSLKAVEIYNILISELEGKVNNLTNVINQVRTLAANDSVRIDSLETVTVNLGERLTALENRADQTDVRLEADSIKLATLEELYNELKDSLANYATIDYVDEADKKLNERIDSILNNVVPDLEGKIADARTYAEELADSVGQLLDDAITAVNGRIDSLADELGDLQDAFDQYVEENNERVGNLEDRVDTLEEKVDGIEKDIEAINGEIEKIKNTMAKFISGITLNGTANPVFGEMNLPFDVRSNVLAAYHGYTSDQGIQFPAYSSAYYASQDDYNRIKGDAAILKAVKNPIDKSGAQTLLAFDGKEGNAGTIYLTVNPTNRNFEGTEFTMINSKNEESSVKLSPLKKSDHKIMFGWDRARQEGEQSPNGFYETKATIDMAALNDYRNRLNIDVEGVKNVISDVKSWRNGISATDIATTLYENVHNVLEADAIKATWTDDVTGEEMSVVSQYAIGAVTVKPLGFAFMQGANYYDNLMSVEKFATDIIDNLTGVLAKYINQVLVKYGSAADYIQSIEYKSYDPETNTITIGVKVPAGVFDEDTKVVWNSNHTKYETVWEKNADGTFTVNIRMSALEDLMQTLYKMYGEDWNNVADNINNWIGLVQNLVDEVNEFLGNVASDIANITGSMGLDKISEYVDYFNKHMKRWLVPNKYVQPLLLVHNNDGYTRISRSSKKFTPISSESFTLIPTTYNVEVLSPAYKKVIVATKVTDASGNNVEAARNAFNNQANMNTVIDGEWQGFDVTIQKGYNYEILYMALDYSGKIAARKYYLRAK